jgi:uncharacterized protein (DUF58 family)
VLRPGAVRVIVSDFLFPHDAEPLVRALVRDAGAAAFLQVLGERDVEPEQGALRLTDAERGAELDLVLDPSIVARYRRRLRALTSALSAECRRTGAMFCQLETGPSLERLCRDRLVPQAVLVPA